jgi:hypothetical protein
MQLRLARLLAGTLLLAPAMFTQGRPDVAVQKAAMQKLSFLAGNWSGDATVTLGPGKPIKVRQTEAVVYKLDGLVMLIEGTGRDESGKVVFNALATVSFDQATNTYRIRAYREGNYVETELKPTANGFEWGFKTGPVTVRNRMTLDEKGRWMEVSDAIMGEGKEFRTVDMALSRDGVSTQR